MVKELHQDEVFAGHCVIGDSDLKIIRIMEACFFKVIFQRVDWNFGSSEKFRFGLAEEVVFVIFARLFEGSHCSRFSKNRFNEVSLQFRWFLKIFFSFLDWRNVANPSQLRELALLS
jgi:hypothetical protein